MIRQQPGGRLLSSEGLGPATFGKSCAAEKEPLILIVLADDGAIATARTFQFVCRWLRIERRRLRLRAFGRADTAYICTRHCAETW